MVEIWIGKEMIAGERIPEADSGNLVKQLRRIGQIAGKSRSGNGCVQSRQVWDAHLATIRAGCIPHAITIHSEGAIRRIRMETTTIVTRGVCVVVTIVGMIWILVVHIIVGKVRICLDGLVCKVILIE